jgi:hypothetical protein
MVPLYAARVRDLGSGDFGVIKCGTCGHTDRGIAVHSKCRFNEAPGDITGKTIQADNRAALDKLPRK